MNLTLFLKSKTKIMIAVGNRHQYNDIAIDIDYQGHAFVALAVHDQRDWVLNKKKDPDFSGYMRSGVGIPYNIGTKSGQAVAADMAQSIALALEKTGHKVVKVPTSHLDTAEEVYKRALECNADRILIVRLDEWFCDTYTKTWLEYKVTASAFDKKGIHMAHKEIAGKDTLGGSFWNPVRFARKAVPIAFKAKMEALFNSNEIRDTLLKKEHE